MANGMIMDDCLRNNKFRFLGLDKCSRKIKISVDNRTYLSIIQKWMVLF